MKHKKKLISFAFLLSIIFTSFVGVWFSSQKSINYIYQSSSQVINLKNISDKNIEINKSQISYDTNKNNTVFYVDETNSEYHGWYLLDNKTLSISKMVAPESSGYNWENYVGIEENYIHFRNLNSSSTTDDDLDQYVNIDNPNSNLFSVGGNLDKNTSFTLWDDENKGGLGGIARNNFLFNVSLYEGWNGDGHDLNTIESKAYNLYETKQNWIGTDNVTFNYQVEYQDSNHLVFQLNITSGIRENSEMFYVNFASLGNNVGYQSCGYNDACFFDTSRMKNLQGINEYWIQSNSFNQLNHFNTTFNQINKPSDIIKYDNIFGTFEENFTLLTQNNQLFLYKLKPTPVSETGSYDYTVINAASLNLANGNFQIRQTPTGNFYILTNEENNWDLYFIDSQAAIKNKTSEGYSPIKVCTFTSQDPINLIFTFDALFLYEQNGTIKASTIPGVNVESYDGNYFVQDGEIVLNDNLYLSITSSNIDSVYLNGDSITPQYNEANENVYYLALSSKEFYRSDYQIKINFKNSKENLNYSNFVIFNNVEPKLNIKSDSSEMEKYVSKDVQIMGYDENYIDTYYVKESQVIISLNEEYRDLINSVWVNDELIEIPDVDKDDYMMTIPSIESSNKLEIKDNFGKTWTSQIIIGKASSAGKPVKYLDTSDGQELIKNAIIDGYTEQEVQSMSSLEIVELESHLSNLFDLLQINVNSQEYISLQTDLYRDIYDWYGGKIPMNTIDKNSTNNEGIALYEVVNNSIINSLNNYFLINQNLKIDSTQFEITYDNSNAANNSVSVSSQKLTIGTSIIVKATPKSSLLGTFKVSLPSNLFIYYDLNYFNSIEQNNKLQSELDQNFNTWFNEHTEYQSENFTEAIQLQLNDIVIKTLNSFSEPWTETIISDYPKISSNDVEITYFSHGKQIDRNTKMRDIEYFNVRIAPKKGSNLVYTSNILNNTIDVKVTNKYYIIPTIIYKFKGLFIFIFSLILLLFIILFIFIFVPWVKHIKKLRKSKKLELKNNKSSIEYSSFLEKEEIEIEDRFNNYN